MSLRLGGEKAASFEDAPEESASGASERSTTQAAPNMNPSSGSATTKSAGPRAIMM